MIVLVLRVCLLADPTVCLQVDVPTDANSVVACQLGIGAQGLMAQWQASHPKWTVDRWECRGDIA